ncbi:MAG: hypothetical protein NT018_11360, partial [Armatimonadetes bacterium]|nr:hypothetical protein [Armatimonadota bacterium]
GFPIRKSCILILNIVCASLPEAGAQCNSLARWDLCGGLRVTSVPTATEYKTPNSCIVMPGKQQSLNAFVRAHVRQHRACVPKGVAQVPRRIYCDVRRLALTQMMRLLFTIRLAGIVLYAWMKRLAALRGVVTSSLTLDYTTAAR